MMSFRDGCSDEVHVALALNPEATGVPLVRIHSECLTGEALGSLKCDCGAQLDMALSMIGEHGSGVLVYLRQEGRGIGLENKIKAYALQEKGLDTVDANLALGLPADARDYAAATRLLKTLAIGRCDILSNNPAKVSAVEQAGITVRERIPLVTRGVHPVCCDYLKTKQTRMGHLL